MSEKREKVLNFEAAIQRLEEIVGTLEEETISLEESLELFEEGMKLTEMCRETLQVAEAKIKTLTRNKSGKLEIRAGILDR